MRNCRPILLLLVGCLFVVEGWGQLSIDQANTVYTINFDDTVAGVNVGQFAGSGFTPAPVGGQLNSDAWKVKGMSDGDGTWGGTHTTDDFARGSSNGGVTTGGIYAFNIGAGNMALGVQPSASDFTPGTITLRVVNNTGCVVTRIAVNYKVYIRNDEDRANSFNFFYSDDDIDINYTNVPALNLISPELKNLPAIWDTNSRSTALIGLTIANGGSFYLRWRGHDIGGADSRDEFALDDVEVIAFSDRDVSALTTTISCNDRAFLEWQNPVSGTCWDEVMIIAREGSAVSYIPSGDGSGYSANNTFGLGTEPSQGEFVVYKGTSEEVGIYSLTADSTYYVKAFTRWGTNWYSGDTHQLFVEEFCYQSVQSGDWTSNTTWEQFDGVQWIANIGYPSTSWHNALVRGNHDVVVNNSPLNCGNLSIELDGRVYNGSSNNRFINIGGDLVCDGVFGSNQGSLDRIGINFNYAYHTISGSGTIDCNRIRKDSFNWIVTNLTISSNVTLRWNGLPLYSFCPNCEFNVTVQPGVMVSLPGNASGPGILTLSRIDVSGFGTLNVFGTVEAAVFRPYNRIQSTQSKYVVHSGGKLLVNGEVFLSDSTSPTRDSVIVLSDGEIKFGKAGQVFINPYNDGNPLSKWVLNAASTAIYSSPSPQTVESDFEYGHLQLEGSGAKTLNGHTLVRGNLSIADGVELDVSSSNHNIALWGDWDNQNQPPDIGFASQSATVFLQGSINQSILSGPGQVFNRLVLDNPAGASLLSPAEITDSLILTSGKLDIGIHNLGLKQAVIAGNFGPTTFIKADSLGYVVANVTTDTTLLPLGRNPYLPLSLSCTGINSTEVYIRLKRGHDLDPVLNPGDTFNSNVVNAQWELLALGPIADFYIKLGWPDSEQLSGFSRFETFIRHWESGSSTYWTNQLPADTASGPVLGPYSRYWTISSLPIGTHFFGVGGNALLLSNASISLTASPGLAGMLLTWQAGELPESGSHWIVERHTGAGNWEAMAELPANTNGREWLDAAPGFGQIYYRIALLGPDGTRVWSNIATGRWERQGIWHIGPNPASTQINITASHLSEGLLQLELYHSSGTRVLEIQAGSGPDMQEQLPISNLAPGVYVLVVSRGSEPILRERIVIQR